MLLLLVLFLVHDHASATLTHCFQYISCMDFAHKNLRQCVGSTALALALEAKEKTFAHFMGEHENATQICQEKLASDSSDYEVLQLLVNDDAHSCFIHLSKSHHLSDINSKDCSCNTLSLRSQSRITPFACLTTFRSARHRCEKLLRCCPEHSRCAERLNTFSVAYQQAKDKVNKILQRLLLCLASEHSLSFPEVVAMQANSMRSRIAGVLFFKPDTSTEQRISRQLNLMSQSTATKRTTERRKKVHAKRFQQARKLLETTLSPQNNKDKTTIIKSFFRNAKESEPLHASLIAKRNLAKLAELVTKKTVSSLRPHSHVHDAIKAALLSKGVKTVKPPAPPSPTVAELYLWPPPQRKERRGSWLASDQDKDREARTYSNRTLKKVLLDESFSKSNCSEAASQKLDREQNVQRLDWKANDTFLQERTKPIVELGLSKIYKDMSPRSKTTVANHYKLPAAELISEMKDRYRVQSLLGQSSTESSSFDTDNGHAAPMSVVDDSEVGVSVEDPHIYLDRISERNIGAFSSNTLTDISQHIHTYLSSEERSAETESRFAISVRSCFRWYASRIKQPRSLKVLPSSVTTSEHTDLESSGDSTHIEGGHSEKRESVREILVTPRTLEVQSAKQTRKKHCAVYADCLETLLDYEGSCEQRYSREYLAHGIDDNEVLGILNENAIIQSTDVQKACLRSVDKMDYAALKQLLVTQRSLRKRCLEQSVQLRRNVKQKNERCPNAIPSTEPLDNLFHRIYYRSESVRGACHTLLNDMRRTCTELEHCCADAKSCEVQLRTTVLQERIDQAKGRLMARYHSCEHEMLKTLKLFESIRDEYD